MVDAVGSSGPRVSTDSSRRERSPSDEDPDDGLLAECRLMLKFLRETGLAVPADLAHDISMLDEVLVERGFRSLSELSPRLEEGKLPFQGSASTSQDEAASDDAKSSLIERVLKVHGALSELIAPATALTLRTTQPVTTGRAMFGRMPPVVKFSAYAAIVSGLLFGASAALIAAEAAAKKAAIQSAQAPVASSQAKATK